MSCIVPEGVAICYQDMGSVADMKVGPLHWLLGSQRQFCSPCLQILDTIPQEKDTAWKNAIHYKKKLCKSTAIAA